MSDACVSRPVEVLEAVERALKDCADELESEVEHRYDSYRDTTGMHPAMVSRYERDMTTVNDTRSALASLRALRATAVEGWAEDDTGGQWSVRTAGWFYDQGLDRTTVDRPALLLLLPSPEEGE